MKKKIGIIAFENSNWVGGLYYKYNIIFSLLQNKYITDNYYIYLFTDEENVNIFNVFSKRIRIVYFNNKNNILYSLNKYFTLLINRLYFIYPANNIRLCSGKRINWIPDFQHKVLPEFFSQNEINDRDISFNKMINSKCPLVLSSNSTYTDLKKYYKRERNIYILKFVSYIEPIINSLNKEKECETLQKYNLLGKKIICCFNQFWKHKNHKIVFDAIDYLISNNEEKLKNCLFVFTGQMYDYRNDKYIEEIKTIMNKIETKKYIINLGFIDRIEQIILMKNCEFVIQPSLFEGWGTVLEDAKTLDKTVLLSNIEVHNEQKSSKCLMFNPYDKYDLAHKIIEELNKNHYDDPAKGIESMYKHAAEYSKTFEDLLKCNQ